jgi:hypothetical protein
VGDHQAARQLDEDTVIRRRRVLGDDDHDTLHTANNLVGVSRDLGQDDQADVVQAWIDTTTNTSPRRPSANLAGNAAVRRSCHHEHPVMPRSECSNPRVLVQ